MVGRLYHLPRKVARARAEELLHRLELEDAADRIVKTFSGGMRRRLDLAASIVTAPPVLFLDEPTTGLDPHSRNELWAMLREFVAGGTTLLLTTQYLEEADRLADRIVVLDHGEVQADGTPAELKARVGGERAVVAVRAASDLGPAADALAPFTEGAATRNEETDDQPQLVVPLLAGTRLVEIVRALDAAGIDAVDVHRREATLDDVFLALTSTAATAARPEVHA
jgi:ABC-2 type transport system ATP-binding protein